MVNNKTSQDLFKVPGEKNGEAMGFKEMMKELKQQKKDQKDYTSDGDADLNDKIKLPLNNELDTFNIDKGFDTSRKEKKSINLTLSLIKG